MFGLYPGDHVHADCFAEHFAAARVNLPDIALHALHVLRFHRLPGKNCNEAVTSLVQHPVATGKTMRPSGVGAADYDIHAISHRGGYVLIVHPKASSLMCPKPFDLGELLWHCDRPLLGTNHRSKNRQNDRQEWTERFQFHCDQFSSAKLRIPDNSHVGNPAFIWATTCRFTAAMSNCSEQPRPSRDGSHWSGRVFHP